jgi:hypothetical protein
VLSDVFPLAKLVSEVWGTRSRFRSARVLPLVIVVCVVAVVGAFSIVDGARGTVPGRNGLIAFARATTNNEEIYVMRPDGSHRKRITRQDFATEDRRGLQQASESRSRALAAPVEGTRSSWLTPMAQV